MYYNLFPEYYTIVIFIYFQNDPYRIEKENVLSGHLLYVTVLLFIGGSRLSGHTNPMYQQSSINSLDQESERPSSARSVYSNYHGTRAFSYMGSSLPPSTFLSRGPPAYNLHAPNKTETVI